MSPVHTVAGFLMTDSTDEESAGEDTGMEETHPEETAVPDEPVSKEAIPDGGGTQILRQKLQVRPKQHLEKPHPSLPERGQEPRQQRRKHRMHLHP